MKIDTSWFETRIKERFGSLREFANHITRQNGKTMDHSALSRTLRGEREFFLSELIQIARLLDASLEETVRRAGYDLSGVPKSTLKR